MYKKRLIIILLLNILGIGLFLSWYLQFSHTFWFNIDKSIFFYFQSIMKEHSNISLIVSIINTRIFDLFLLLILGLFYITSCVTEKQISGKRIFSLGINIILTSIILNKIGHLIPIQHVSPTLFFNTKHYIHNVVGMIVKDSSTNSFPGDHGMLLMIFSCFIFRYFNMHTFLKSLCITITFILPRIIVGAHWFTDIFIGSLSVVIIGISWWFLTLSSDRFMDFIDAVLSKKYPH